MNLWRFILVAVAAAAILAVTAPRPAHPHASLVQVGLPPCAGPSYGPTYPCVWHGAVWSYILDQGELGPEITTWWGGRDGD